MTTKNHADQASLSSLRELALAATPGPWQAQQRNKQEAIYIVGPDHTPPACHAFYANNADYIAAAHPATVLALLDDLEAAHTARREAQARVAELTEQVQALGRKLHRHKLDTARLDWLADRENAIGNVQLPTECVQAHPESLRAAIDAAMRRALMKIEGGEE